MTDFRRALAIVGGCCFAAYGIWLLWAEIRKATWRRTEGRITGYLVDHPWGDSTEWSADPTYEYEVDGHRYVGDRVALGPRASMSNRALAVGEVQERFPINRSVTVYYDPEWPDRCVLNRSPRLGGFAFAFVAALICFIIGLAPLSL